MEVIRTADILYNEVVDPYFERQHGTLEQVLAVTMEDLAEFSWKEFLEEEVMESSFETYLDKLTEQMTNLGTGENVFLCGTKLRENISDRGRRETDELPYV